VITGTGRGFCSGANLTATGPDDITGRHDLGLVLKQIYYPVLLRRLRNLPIPSVVAVNGPATGFGLSLALMGDLVLAARKRVLSAHLLAHRSRARWRRALAAPSHRRWARAKELVMLAERLSAEKALEWGLINQVHDDDKAAERRRRLGEDLTTRPPRRCLSSARPIGTAWTIRMKSSSNWKPSCNRPPQDR